jgi:alkanesulfonate monooxygenase SsuD/methylene tetrahydromethanopterin reductase-like flavin-dependent oxidoreductase (luciferase family)
MQGIWTNDLFEYHGEFADFPLSGFGHKPLQKPGPPIYFSGLKDPKRSAKRIAKYGLQGWIGIQDSPEDIKRWKGEMERELGELGRGFPDGFDMCSMIWFVITDEPMDQTPRARLTNLLAGNAQQIEDILKRYKEAGHDHAAPVAAVPRRAHVQDHRRHQAPRRGDHAQGQRRVGPAVGRAGYPRGCPLSSAQ